MKRYIPLAFLLLASPAQAQRVQNLSMSPEEMRKQNVQTRINPTTTNNRLPGNDLMPSVPTQNGYPVISAPGAQQPVNNQGHFMDGYCDPNFKPLLARNPKYAGMANCLEQQKQQACGLYAALPPDARGVMDATMDCMAQQQNGGLEEAPDGTLQPTAAPAIARDCSYNDSQRLNLLKRYWQDANTAYALVFIPDLAMDAGGSCMGGR